MEHNAEGRNDLMSETTLVFIHGSGDSARCWSELIPLVRWAPERVVALDLPGHGARADEPLPAQPTISAYAGLVRATLDARGIRRAIVVGHSLGGAIALRLALDAPDLVEGFALVGSGARLRVLPALLEAARTDPTGTGHQLVRLGYAPNHQEMADAYFASMPPVARDALAQDLTACDAFDVMAELDGVTQRALVIVGSEDRLTPPKYAQYSAEHLPRATLVVVPEAGHYVQREAPDAVAAALNEWLSRQQD